MLMTRPGSRAQSLVGQDLHVARQDDEVDIVLVHEFEHACLGGGLGRGRHGDVLERHTVALRDRSAVVVVGDHYLDVDG
jgi:hypothetical protein